MTAIPEAAAVALGATTTAGAIATVLLARSRAAFVKAARSQAARADHAEAREQELRDEIRHLVTARLPAYAQHLVSTHHPVPGLLSPHLSETESGKLLEAVLGQFAEAILTQRRRIDAAAWAAVRGTSSHTQSVANRMQDVIDELQRKHDNAELLDAFFGIDHLNEQMIRHLQKAAIAGGGWPGHVQQDSHVPDVVTGAHSRLHGYERIQIVSNLRATNVGIVGRAAEPIAVACAELMANALEHSSDDLRVTVTLLQTDNGTVSIQIDDAGTGMTAEERARGTRLVSGEGAGDLLLTQLGDPPAFGFPAIGRLVADYGFQVSIDQPSPYNGVRAVLSIPPHLLVEINELANPVSAMAPLPAPPPRKPQRSTPQQANASAPDSELPQRHRKQPQTSPGVLPAPSSRTPEPESAGAMWSDFQDGLIAARIDPETKDAT
ncbi:ATP-binding protein [Streptomyces sp. NPDC102441]|uniref:ATP-binding protein n=1 Tax=Streptomyces sp. NPDC102441 TaxID=3366176 RepID=UPI00381D4DC1